MIALPHRLSTVALSEDLTTAKLQISRAGGEEALMLNGMHYGLRVILHLRRRNCKFQS